MIQCPNCGTRVDEGDTVCTACGTALGEPSHQQGSGRRQSPGRASSGETPQGRGPSQGGQPRGQRAPASGGGAGDVVAGLTRRQVIALGAGAVAASGGGYLLLSGGGGPKAVAKEFVKALRNGNTGKANAMLHPDSPLTRSDVNALAMNFQAGQLTVQSATVAEQTGNRARVELKVASELRPSVQQPITIELRKSGGQWKVVVFSFGS